MASRPDTATASAAASDPAAAAETTYARALLPRPPGGTGAGFAVSVGAHAVLLAALAGVVQWRTQTPVVAAAELWSSLPEVAAAPAPPSPVPSPPAAAVPAPAPAPPPPPPAAAAPRPPDIATEQARDRAERAERERQERERADKERQRREREQRDRTAAAEQERQRQQAEATERARDEQLRRMMQAAGAPAGPGTNPTGTAPRDAAPSASYLARLAAAIRSNAVFSGEVPGNPAAEVEVRTAAGGAILSRRLVKSSGHAAWDEAVLRAIDRTGKLPPDTDGRVPGTLIISFRPKE
jgi:colicin import membrane protein